LGSCRSAIELRPRTEKHSKSQVRCGEFLKELANPITAKQITLSVGTSFAIAQESGVGSGRDLLVRLLMSKRPGVLGKIRTTPDHDSGSLSRIPGGQTVGTRSGLRRWGAVEERPMRADFCWAKAEEYARRAAESEDKEISAYFTRVRDNWIRAGNCERFFLDDRPDALPKVAAHPIAST
jgi:hypothetical protein